MGRMRDRRKKRGHGDRDAVAGGGGGEEESKVGDRRGRDPQPVGYCGYLLGVISAVVVLQMGGVIFVEGYTQEEVSRAGFDLNCGLGFTGLQCQQVVTCEEKNYCNGHGICMRGGRCMCDPGWRGDSCDEAYCPSNCTGHGACMQDGSGCLCDSGFSGTICNKVACFGGGNCTGHGACLDGGVCQCDQGYLGAGCDQVDVVLKCSNRGTVDENGNCVCSLWYTGPDCSLVLCMNNCSNHGSCDLSSGKCLCDPGWSAADCSKQQCPSNCTGHGTCFGGQCECQSGFSGDDCSIFPCQNDCSGHGACYNGTCACDLDWGEQPDCSLYRPVIPLPCPNNCTGQGSCANSTCFCDLGWQGLDCSQPVWCPGNCTGHGACANATCGCDVGFFGDDCSQTECFNNCTQHGSCTSNGTCACDAGHFGADCSLSDLDCGGPGMSGNCTGHGTCVDAGQGQWWSGDERRPDMWEMDGMSSHLGRRDTLGCLMDYYGLPGELMEGGPGTEWRELNGRRTLISRGVPDHLVLTHNGVPLCETPWTVSLPLHPQKAERPSPLEVDGVIGFALNGVPVWGAELQDGSNAVEGAQRVPCYGHASSTGMWHYHHPLFGCDAAANQETLLGYALDGFPIYGPLSGSASDIAAVLDVCNGRTLPDGTYRYHVRTLAQVDENRPSRPARNASTVSIDGVRFPTPADLLASTSWNYVLGCFSGVPATSLGLRPVMAPLRTVLGGWEAGGAAVLTDDPRTQAATVAQQLGLEGRVGMCVCDPGWVGPDCDSPGCAGNCSGHGSCMEISSNESRCECDATWMGDDCSMRFNGTCGDGCSGHGSCLWPHQENATCLCDHGWGGGDCSDSLVERACAYNCSSRGSCWNGTCVCDTGFTGQGCEMTTSEYMNLNSTLCWQWINGRVTNNSCSGQGACLNGTCVCDPGWSGQNCSIIDSGPPPRFVECPSNCTDHGACTFVLDAVHNTYNGTCSCDAGWDGPDCSLFWGGAVCEHNCSEHGSCQNGTCVCDGGWTGDDCTVTWASLERLCPMNCSDHGTCQNGTCTCDHGWLGENCSMPLPCPGDCSGHGVCDLGNCTCDPGWAGADCSHADVCPGYLPLAGVNCSGHGVCIDGNCSCDVGWGGYDCSEAGCLNSCSGRGNCVNGTCLCMTGYIGADCGLGPYKGECPGRCTGHGACSIVDSTPLPNRTANVFRDGLLTATVGCVCDEGWDGPDCSLRACPNDCSGNGACAQNGTCMCYRNWGGPACDEASCPGTGDCNGRGTCVGGVGCVCDVGYQGPECTQSACANNCSMNGMCVPGPGVEYGANKGEEGYEYVLNTSYAVCDCFFGWGGIDCSEISCPLNCSFPQGQCINGTCACDSANGYFGQNCSEKFGLIGLRTDGTGLSPSFGIFSGGSTITVRGTGFVNSNTMRCRFGGLDTPASIVQPTPPELPFAVCKTPSVPGPRQVTFQFSLDNIGFTEVDARVQFTYHGLGVLQSIRWPTGPSSGGTEIILRGFNFQFATDTRCKFGDYEVVGSQTIYFVEDPVTEVQSKEGTLYCTSPPLDILNLPASASATVDFYVSMDAGAAWMQFVNDPSFRYYDMIAITPSFGPQQDQVTAIRVHGFNLFQGLQMAEVFPGFSYQYACSFNLPWVENQVQVLSGVETWNVRTAPYDGAFFSCTVPPGLVTGGGYTGPVDVTISLNPCMSIDGAPGCSSQLPFTLDPITFYYATSDITSLSVTQGPNTGGTVITIGGTYFNLRDTAPLPAGHSHLPILCRFGELTEVGVYQPDDSTVVCTAPACTTPACLAVTLDQCPACMAPVDIEVAVNGQDFTDTKLSFSYYKDPLVSRVFPTLGPTTGGTMLTVFAAGFGDPCIGCSGAACDTCGEKVKCRFLAFDRILDTPATCLRGEDGQCDRSQLVCPTPLGQVLRGNIVSLEPFFVAVSVSTNGQQFFPVKVSGAPFNVNDPKCTDTQSVNCAFKFKYYENPIITSVTPSITAGDGNGRVTITGSNFLNVNDLRCRFGDKVGTKACQSGSTDSVLPCSPFGCCVGAGDKSAIFVSSTKIICPLLDLQPTDPSDPLPTQVKAGISLNGQNGPNDYVYLLNPGPNNVKEDAIKVYWALSIYPSLGINDPGTRITVTGVNFGAYGAQGDVFMRCKFGNNIVVPNPTLNPDPVNFQNDQIECTSPGSPLDVGAGKTQELVDFGICLVGSSCEYTGPLGQGDQSSLLHSTIHHFTGGISFLFYKEPQLNILTPSLAPITGGTAITITGTGFFKTDVLACRFDIGHFSPVTRYISTTMIACETPAMSAGVYQMDITLNDQDYSAGCGLFAGGSGICDFKVYIEPTIVDLKPKAGRNTGGTRVQLTVVNPVIEAGQLLACRFYPVDPVERERLEIEGIKLIDNQALLSSSTVTCTAPSTVSPASGLAVLKTPTVDCPTCGQTIVRITWNGQQYSSVGADVQLFNYHVPIRISSLSPLGGYTTGGDTVDVIGEGFVDTPFLVLKFGDSLFMCAQGAPQTECPLTPSFQQNAITFIDSNTLRITTPSSTIATRKNIVVSNNYQEFSSTVGTFDYYTTQTPCPPSIVNVCRGNGQCLVIPSTQQQACVCSVGYSGVDCSIGPQVIKIVPSIGLASGGYNVLVHAQNVAYDAQQQYRVRIGGTTTLTATLISPNLLSFRVPTATETGYVGVSTVGRSVEITVNNVIYTSNNVILRLLPDPTITRMIPNAGNFMGNTRVTLVGTNFFDTEMLSTSFGPLEANKTTFLSSTSVVTHTPPCGSRCGNFSTKEIVSLTMNSGVSSTAPSAGSEADVLGFRYVPQPVHGDVTPNTGSANGGTPAAFAGFVVNGNSLSCEFGSQVVSGTYDVATGRMVCSSPPTSTAGVVPVSFANDGQVFSENANCTAEPTRCFRYRDPISVTRVVPTLGPVGGSTPVTIVGSNFYFLEVGQATCRFGDYTSPMSFVDSQHYACLSPPQVVGNVPFSISPNGVDSVGTGSFQFSYYLHPTLVSSSGDTLIPMGSPLEGGTSVTIGGTNFRTSGDGIRVRFMATDGSGRFAVSSPAQYVKSGNIDEIRCISPVFTNATEQVPVAVSVSLNNGLQYSPAAVDTFVYYTQPDFTEIVPHLGPRLGETPIVLLGSGFVNLRGNAKCKFGSQVVTAFFDDSGATPFLRCISPPAPVPTWVNVEVALDGQVFTNVKKIKFQYYGEFDVYSIQPAGGPAAGGTTTTITGVGFFMSGTLLQCFFGDGFYQCSVDNLYPCYVKTAATYISPTTVTCKTPEIPPGGLVTQQYPVRLGINGQFSQACPNVQPGFACPLKSGLVFTYYTDITVGKILPNSGQVMGGTRVTITGTNFRQDLDYVTKCVFTRCLQTDVYTSELNFGNFRPGKTVCSGGTVMSQATAVLDTQTVICETPLAESADSHFAQVDVSLNDGSTIQRRYGPTCPDGGCPVKYYFYSLPLISTLSPALGPEAGGTVVTIVGVGFIGHQNTPLKCKFGEIESTFETTGVAEPVKWLTQSTMRCVAPPQAAGSVRMSVSLNGLEGDYTDPLLGAMYIYHTPPVLTGVPRPSTGAARGGTTITVSGTGFRPGDLRCKFWTTPEEGNLNKVTVATYLGPTSASCPTPAVPSSQLVSISLSLNAQDFSPSYLPRLFFFFPNPVITSLSPRGGPAESGGWTMVNGVGFVNTATVKCKFGDLEAEGVYHNSTAMACRAPQIQAKDYSAEVLSLGVIPVEVLPGDFSPSPVQNYPVEVSFDGQTYTSDGKLYTYYPSPQVDLLTPSFSRKDDATVIVVLNGANFRTDIATPRCRFGAGQAPVQASYLSSRAMMCRPNIMTFGQRVLVEVSLNGQDFEAHKSSAYYFYGVAPVPVSATLNADYCAVNVEWDVPTNKANKQSSFLCSELMGFADDQASFSLSSTALISAHAGGADGVFQTMFGEGTTCSFSDNSTLTVNIGYGGKFRLNQEMTVLPGQVMRGKELTEFGKGNVTITNPLPLPQPSVKIVAPTTIGVCDRFKASATSSTGGACRPLYYTWSLDLQNSRVTDDNLTPTQKGAFLSQIGQDISAFSGISFDKNGVDCRHPNCRTCLQRDSSGTCTVRSNTTYSDCACDSIDVDFSSMPMGYYAVFGVVTNWLGSQSDPVVVTVTKVAQPLPAVTIIMVAGGESLDRVVNVNTTANADSIIVPSACSTDASKNDLVITWTLTRVSDSAVMPLSSNAAAAIALPPFTLLPGVRYALELKAQVRSNALYTGKDTVYIVGKATRPVAVIKGGTHRTAGIETVLTLDGGQTFHPDFAPSNQAAASLSYQWSCIANIPSLAGAPPTTGPCTSQAGLAFGSAASSQLLVSANTMKRPSEVTSYTFTLTVSSSASGSVQTGAAKVVVTPVLGPLHTVDIIQSSLSPVYVSNIKITLDSQVIGTGSSAVSYQWTTSEGDVDISRIQYTLTPSTSQTLVIKPGVLTPGNAYTIRLTATADGRSAFDEVSFVVKKAPSGGSLTVSPTSGTAGATVFTLEARSWETGEVSGGGQPLTYQFERVNPITQVATVIAPYSMSSVATSMLPRPPASTALTAGEHWKLRVRIRNGFQAEKVWQQCNGNSLCDVPVAASTVYVNKSAVLADNVAILTSVTTMISSGDAAGALNYINMILLLLNDAPTNTTAAEGGGGRRRVILDTESSLMMRRAISSADSSTASFKCGTIAPLLAATLPADIASDASHLTLAQGAASNLVLIFSTPSETNDMCTSVCAPVLQKLIDYVDRNPLTEPDSTVMSGIIAGISGIYASQQLLLSEAVVTSSRAESVVSDLLTKEARFSQVVGYGSSVAEAVKNQDSTLVSIDTQRLAATVTTSRRGGEAGGGTGEGVARGRNLLAMGSGTTTLPGLSFAYGDVSILMASANVPVAIPKLACAIDSSGATVCPAHSVSVAVNLFKSLFNPWFYNTDVASTIVSPIVWLQIRPFGIAEDIPLTGTSQEIFYTVKLSRIPDSGEDSFGRRRVATCVLRGSSGWELDKCRLSDRTTDITGSEVRITCACKSAGLVAVQDLPAGCDSVPYSTLLYDSCRVCGGDNSTCRGCDGVVASGKVLDGCNVCGGDNSSCAGCDNVPNSGRKFDWCGVCGGDNSTCTGCDGETVHSAVTARTGLVPKQYDVCQSATHPLGVCGGCGASCAGCDGVPNSGKDWDKCGKCGPFSNPGADQYSVSTKDNCTLGLTSCESGFAPDACAICQPLSGSSTANQACMGCDGIPRLFGRKYPDVCGLCGGDTCSCKDCNGVPNGGAKYDRCGVCNGNNTCLDCQGIPYGSALLDICGICGGRNDPVQCTGCDGRIYPRPTTPPYLDANGECCQAANIGCNGLCNATVGCDGLCSKNPKLVDKCGICGGGGQPNTGTCDCAGTPNGQASVGCDGLCSFPAKVIDTCGVCGGTNQAETGHCDCAGVPYGPSLRDSANLCCTVGDMGCASDENPKEALCFSGKTYDICGVCGGDGGTCLPGARPGAASVHGPPPQWLLHLLSAAVLVLCAAVDDWTRPWNG